MVAEPWILKMGNQVSHNLKHALYLEHSSKKRHTKKPEHKEIIGILSFEVANVMSKTIHLHKSLRDQDIYKLKNEILKSEGVKNLVSSNESYLLELALAEKFEDLNRVASVVSRLGKKCTEPALLGFEHVYGDIMNGVIDVGELGFLVKDMEAMVRKMERYVNATLNLYSEMEVLSELEQATKKFQQNQHEESRRAFEQKLIWQKQDVRHLKDVSLWNQTYDKVVELLARTVCTIYARICVVFGVLAVRRVSLGLFEGGSDSLKDEYGEISGQIDVGSQMVSEPLKRVLSKRNAYHSGLIERVAMQKSGANFKQQIDSRRGDASILRPEEEGKYHSGLIDRVEKRGASFKPRLDSRSGDAGFLPPEDFIFPCGVSPGRLFLECLSLSSSGSKLDDDDVADHEDQGSQTSGCCSVVNGLKKEHPNQSGYFNGPRIGVPFSGDQRQSKCGLTNSSRFATKSRLTLRAPPSSIGGSALALHYANVIIVIEKLLRYPHLVGEEARDDLYQMLPTSLRMSLRMNLKSYVKNLAIYDAPLAHDWKATLDEILRWLAPLAHNMIRWQSERNFEQQQIVTRTNVLLLQTLYFADREKTEAAICELLVGLNYICRYEHQQNALLDCASSFDFDDCMEWHMQSSYLH